MRSACDLRFIDKRIKFGLIFGVTLLLAVVALWAYGRRQTLPDRAAEALSVARDLLTAPAVQPQSAAPTTAEAAVPPRRVSTGSTRTGGKHAPRATDDARPRGAAAAATPSAQGPFAFRGLRWGMTMDEVAAVLPITAERGAAGRRSRVATASTDLDGRPFVASLLFDRAGRLNGVQLAPAEEFADPSVMFDEVAMWVSRQSGDPTSRREGASPSGSWRRITSWTTADSRIELRAWQTMLADARIVQFELSTGEAQAADAPGFVLSYEPNRPLARGP